MICGLDGLSCGAMICVWFTLMSMSWCESETEDRHICHHGRHVAVVLLDSHWSLLRGLGFTNTLPI